MIQFDLKHSVSETKLLIRRRYEKVLNRLITNHQRYNIIVQYYGTQLVDDLYHGYEHGYKVFPRNSTTLF